jgi:hypothetical protein
MEIPDSLPADALEWRRFRALHLKRQGWSRHDIAEALGISPVSVYLLPGVVRTYAPEDRTPVLREKQTRDHLSVMGGMTPAGQVYTLARQESLKRFCKTLGLKALERLQSRMELARALGLESRRRCASWVGRPQ